MSDDLYKVDTFYTARIASYQHAASHEEAFEIERRRICGLLEEVANQTGIEVNFVSAGYSEITNEKNDERKVRTEAGKITDSWTVGDLEARAAAIASAT